VSSGLLARSAEAAMKRAGTNIRPDQPTLAVVSDGPFRFTRNPLYLSLTGLYLGITLLADALWPLLLLVPVLVVLQWGVVAREERYLEAKFGEPYRAYKARVRRWV
jgi:protein-S-isoprenylcysteine O-methyltransferase Ste14